MSSSREIKELSEAKKRIKDALKQEKITQPPFDTKPRKTSRITGKT